jgi:hypothetical protein
MQEWVSRQVHGFEENKHRDNFFVEQGAALFVVVLNMNTLSSFLGSPATM